MDLECKNNGLRWLIFSGVAAYFCLINIDFTVVNLALPTIGRQLNTSANMLQWMLNAFFLVVSGMFVFGGKLVDFFGTKRTFLTGLILFMLASTMCGMAQQGWEVVIGRGIQGLALAITFSCGMLLAQSVFPEERRGQVIGYVMAVVGFSQAVGPSFGGFLIHWLNWRWIFLINIPFSLYSLLIVSIFVVNKPGHQKWSFDFLGNVLWITGILLISVGLTLAHPDQIYSIKQIILVLAGCLALIIFVLCERKISNPLIHFELLANRNYLFLIIVRVAAQLSFFTYLFILSLYLQNILGYSILQSSYLLLAVSLAQAAAGLSIGKFSDQYGYKLTSIIGMAGLLLSTALAFFFSDRSVWLLILFSMCISFSAGMVFTCGMVAVLKNVEAKNRGVATGLYYSVAFTATTLGIAGFSFITSVIAEKFVLANTSLSQVILPLVKKGIMGGLPLQEYVGNFSLYPHLFNGIIGQFQYGMQVMLAIFFALSLLGLICIFKVKES